MIRRLGVRPLMIAAATIMSFVSVATVAAQWTYRNPSVPRTKDGKPDLKARVLRRPGHGRPLRGLADRHQVQRKSRRRSEAGRRRHAAGGTRAVRRATGEPWQRRSRGLLSGAGCAARQRSALSAEDRSDAHAGGDPLRNANDVSTDLSRCTALAVERRATYLDGLLKGTLGETLSSSRRRVSTERHGWTMPGIHSQSAPG